LLLLLLIEQTDAKPKMTFIKWLIRPQCGFLLPATRWVSWIWPWQCRKQSQRCCSFYL